MIILIMESFHTVTLAQQWVKPPDRILKTEGAVLWKTSKPIFKYATKMPSREPALPAFLTVWLKWTLLHWSDAESVFVPVVKAESRISPGLRPLPVCLWSESKGRTATWFYDHMWDISAVYICVNYLVAMAISQTDGSCSKCHESCVSEIKGVGPTAGFQVYLQRWHVVDENMKHDHSVAQFIKKSVWPETKRRKKK